MSKHTKKNPLEDLQEVGNPDCFGTHVAALPQRYEWTVSWDNGHAVDTLGVYDSEQAAINAGESWLMDMIAIDSDPVAASEVYGFEVLDPKEVPNSPEDIKKAIANLKEVTDE